MKKNTKRTIVLSILVVVAAIFFAGCAHVQPVQACLDTSTHTFGFFGGIWNGLTAVFALIGKIFNHNITIFAVNNTGWLYECGFIIGAGGLGFGVGLFK
jgi:hypothetical protein